MPQSLLSNMAGSKTLSPHPVLELLEGYRRSKTLFAAVQLGIFDGARPAGKEIARLLDACVSLGLLEKRAGGYWNTPLANEYLAGSSPRSLASYARFSNDVLYPLWGGLEKAVLDGPNNRPRPFGGGRTPAEAEKLRRDFVMGMHGTGVLSSPGVAAAFDLSRFSRFVDLGGATGHLAAAVRELYPDMAVTLFDLPPVIAAAAATTGPDIELVAGNFYLDSLPNADLFALGRVLHNLTDEDATRLLGRINDVLPPGGGLLIAERLLDDDRSGPATAHLQMLNMLVCTGGRERTVPEYCAILRASGFREIRTRITGSLLDAILAIA
jgi:acetylserotonin N-methyltransferase